MDCTPAKYATGPVLSEHSDSFLHGIYGKSCKNLARSTNAVFYHITYYYAWDRRWETRDGQ